MKKILLVILFSVFFAGQIISQDIIEMKKDESGVYTIPCEVNGLKLRFIFDTGASAVSISLTEATFMLKNGYLDDSDITGTTNVQTADGKIAENYVINLKELKIGSVTLNNVRAVVSSGLDAPLLLGQSVLDKLGHWSIKESKLILNDFNNQNLTTDTDIETYCNMLFHENGNRAVLEYLRNLPDPLYKDVVYLNHKILYLKYYLPEVGDSEYALQCIEAIKSFDYDTYAFPEYKYERYLDIARFYKPELNQNEIYLYVARDNSFPFDIREQAYESLFLTYWRDFPNTAKNFAIEAIGQEMYELAPWYCGYYLMEEGRNAEAFEIYNEGMKKNNFRCKFAIGRGYVNGYWPTKNLNLGLKILDELAQLQYADALYDLCDYYWDNMNIDKMLSYAKLFEDYTERNVYEGIAYFLKKDYRFAFNRLKSIEMSHVARNDLRAHSLGILGEIYEKGLGGNLDFEKAFETYNKLVEYDAAWGYGMLGDMFFLNELMETDAERAYQYYILGANNNSGYCCFRLALMNYYGAGTYKNEVKAREYKAKALKMGFKPTDFDF